MTPTALCNELITLIRYSQYTYHISAAQDTGSKLRTSGAIKAMTVTDRQCQLPMNSGVPTIALTTWFLERSCAVPKSIIFSSLVLLVFKTMFSGYMNIIAMMNNLTFKKCYIYTVYSE